MCQVANTVVVNHILAKVQLSPCSIMLFTREGSLTRTQGKSLGLLRDFPQRPAVSITYHRYDQALIQSDSYTNMNRLHELDLFSLEPGVQTWMPFEGTCDCFDDQVGVREGTLLVPFLT